jgi:hypothetical protein
MLRDLIAAFDDEDGMSGNMYVSVRRLIAALMGDKAAEVFGRYIDDTDGRFYLKEAQADNCWGDICMVAASPKL